MKKRLALLSVIAAAAVAYNALKNRKSEAIENVENIEKENSVEAKKIELPNLPQQSILSDALLESYRTQCRVMMDAFAANKEIDVIHHIEMKDTASLKAFAKVLKDAKYRVKKCDDSVSLDVTESIATDAQLAFDAVEKMASMTQKEEGLYQGWIFDNCR